MPILRGRVESGRIVVDEPLDLPDGTEVEIAVLEDADEMTADERAEIEGEIDAGLKEAERGEGSPAEDVLRRLRSLG